MIVQTGNIVPVAKFVFPVVATDHRFRSGQPQEELMSKYEPWRRFLATMSADEIVVTFRQLEEMASLPRSAHRDAQWWNDEAGRKRTAQARAWLDAGYFARPDMKAKTVSFRKVQGPYSKG